MQIISGEETITGADNVLMFEPFSDRKRGISGHLFVTNFKISFVTADKSSYPDGDVSFFQNYLLIYKIATIVRVIVLFSCCLFIVSACISLLD